VFCVKNICEAASLDSQAYHYVIIRKLVNSTFNIRNLHTTETVQHIALGLSFRKVGYSRRDVPQRCFRHTKSESVNDF
jgi:hypothetical protein